MTQFGTTTSLAFALLTLAAGCSSSTTRDDSGSDARADAVADGSADASVDTGEPGCPSGEARFIPGCDDGFPAFTPIVPGCYRTCEGEGDTSCGGGLVCTRTVTDPCVCAGSEGCCAACGAETWLCLAPPPPPIPCAGRSFCDCSAECEPLIDTSTGCICNCDAPFNCTGETCACICGGATYLDCAPAGQCGTTEIDCGSCPIVMVDGCPTCDPACTPAP